MDLSKLPRMSQTPARPEPQQPGPSERGAGAGDAYVPLGGWHPAPHPHRIDVGSGPEAWLAAIIGLLFVFFGWRFGRWLAVTLTGGTFDSGARWSDAHPQAGQPVPYWQVDHAVAGWSALSDMALFVFGVALLLESAALLSSSRASAGAQRAIVGAAALVAGAATVLNLLALIVLMSRAPGLPLLSALAVAFGGYMTLTLFRSWAALRSHSA